MANRLASGRANAGPGMVRTFTVVVGVRYVREGWHIVVLDVLSAVFAFEVVVFTSPQLEPGQVVVIVGDALRKEVLLVLLAAGVTDVRLPGQTCVWSVILLVA